MAGRSALHEWIEALPEEGRYVFARADADAATAASAAATKMTLYRLKKGGTIVSPRRDFFVVVPREYRAAGCPPASWFIDDLMGHLGWRYYVGLLSAAALHGAGHQQPMAFQVMVDAAARDIEVGRVRIEFHMNSNFDGAATEPMQTETGTMRVATPETTAFDLVRFPGASGYWSNIATVLSELAEKLDPEVLAAAATRVARTDVQRLGWLLDLVEQPELADALAATVAGKRLLPTPLTGARASVGAPLDPRWHVLVNDDVEADL
ncbi:MAG: type IV toxin-antitoxin system AbiEi family antitoxin [Deltaproteobacteria bacterium]|nr:type IV toxin-antitoxin system AbiEi family antitoxin [Deltaproteobacteria bacterium]MCB9787946.1 type IV toxin-antitoxin system AbiEi family antitoxin [Deltaproteobacteria bacterium]